MLSRKEYLLICLIEELGEVQKELSKVLRFTENDSWLERNFSNKDYVDIEWSEVHGVLHLLERENFKLNVNPFIADEKITRLEKFYDHSVELKVVPRR